MNMVTHMNDSWLATLEQMRGFLAGMYLDTHNVSPRSRSSRTGHSRRVTVVDIGLLSDMDRLHDTLSPMPVQFSPMKIDEQLPETQEMHSAFTFKPLLNQCTRTIKMYTLSVNDH